MPSTTTAVVPETNKPDSSSWTDNLLRQLVVRPKQQRSWISVVFMILLIGVCNRCNLIRNNLLDYEKALYTTRTDATTMDVVPNSDQFATVMAMATGYELIDYQRFVGSLRKTGFQGNIILAVAPDIKKDCEDYLRSKNVIVHKVQYTKCSHPVKEGVDRDSFDRGSDEQELLTCLDPYPKLKHRWARFPLLRDYLLECGGHDQPKIQCGGPVLVTDMRDTFFQRNPFGPQAPKVHGLQLFAEHYTIRTTNWLVDWPVGDCKGIHFDEPMLCSGTTIGTRQAMLDYLEIFHREMNVWMDSPKCCCFETNGDDQSIHNYIYYNRMLDGVSGGAHVIPNRNGLVHTVGAHLSLIFQTHIQTKKELRAALKDPERPVENAEDDPLDLSPEEERYEERQNMTNWLGLQYGLTDEQGYFLDYDGSRSFVIHQHDRIGYFFTDWADFNRETLYYP